MDLTTLPFDQYGRYRMIADALAAVRPLLGGRLRVLDVGGYFRSRRGAELLPAREFLPDDDVTVLDQVESALPGYVRGDGRGLAFGDASFDFVISCDTLEHVPAADRPAFWRELARVARLGVALIAPAKSPEADAAEELVLQYIARELDQRQPQLLEHRAYGLPDPAATAALLGELGLRAQSFPSGNVHAWVLMMLARHTRPVCDDLELCEQLDAYYTAFFGAADRAEPSYRRLWLVETVAEASWYEAAAAALAATVAPPAAPAIPQGDLIGWMLQVRALRLSTMEHRAALQRIEALEQIVAQRDHHIYDLVQRVAWQGRQVEEAQAELQRVKGGRVMRLLRRLGRV